ncbi:CPBP family intramembrane glutamic endopeptidase [Streptomyces chartreusis]|uniref:CPBP family intramembrane glutamic endopeptidase n=1 Tax=Streptomyces chartreusis TaxID=1969 RepID=UPI00364E91E0
MAGSNSPRAGVGGVDVDAEAGPVVDGGGAVVGVYQGLRDVRVGGGDAGQQGHAAASVLPTAMILAAYLPGLLIQMLTTGLADEPGWREFAMPRLQSRYGLLSATLVVGVLWGAWHLPLFLTDWGGGPHVAWSVPAEFVATALLFNAVMTWVFNKSGESMPLVMLLHCDVNNFSIAWSDLSPPSPVQTQLTPCCSPWREC